MIALKILEFTTNQIYARVLKQPTIYLKIIKQLAKTWIRLLVRTHLPLNDRTHFALQFQNWKSIQQHCELFEGIDELILCGWTHPLYLACLSNSCDYHHLNEFESKYIQKQRCKYLIEIERFSEALVLAQLTDQTYLQCRILIKLKQSDKAYELFKQLPLLNQTKFLRSIDDYNQSTIADRAIREFELWMILFRKSLDLQPAINQLSFTQLLTKFMNNMQTYQLIESNQIEINPINPINRNES
jgi:hypothetical protein